MDKDDDEAVGLFRPNHFLATPSREFEGREREMNFLQVPDRNMRGSSVSSNLSDMDAPIYCSDTLTTKVPEYTRLSSLKVSKNAFSQRNTSN